MTAWFKDKDAINNGQWTAKHIGNKYWIGGMSLNIEEAQALAKWIIDNKPTKIYKIMNEFDSPPTQVVLLNNNQYFDKDSFDTLIIEEEWK